MYGAGEEKETQNKPRGRSIGGAGRLVEGFGESPKDVHGCRLKMAAEISRWRMSDREMLRVRDL